MKQLFIAGNWKSNKSISESITWLTQFRSLAAEMKLPFEKVTTVVCAPYLSLPALAHELQENPLAINLASQDVSPYKAGAYTGEVTSEMLKEVAQWTLIGHSERRKYFGETDELLAQKVQRAHEGGLKVIYCVPDEHTAIPANVEVVAYEPVWAIGTGKTDTPENASAVVATIKKSYSVTTVLYGGSVTSENVLSFVSGTTIDGVLPGGASLKPDSFAALIANAGKISE